MFGIKEKLIKTEVIDGVPVTAHLIGMMDNDSGRLIASSVNNKSGSTPTDDTGTYDATTTESVKISLADDDDSCIWAYEHDDATYTAVKKLAHLINTDLVPVISKEFEKDKKVQDAVPLLKKQILTKLRPKIGSVVTYNYLHAVSYLKKLYDDDNKKLIGCIELDPVECLAIRDLSNGELGGVVGLGIDPDYPEREIALVQKGHTSTYDSDGTQTLIDMTFYFTRDQIIPFSINDRGKFKGISPIMRMLRIIALRRTIVNIVEVVLRRFGPQVIVTVGNKDVNFSGNEIPASYLRNSTTNAPIDRATAKANYRKAVMNNVKSKIQRWVDTDTLVHLQEYGYSVETLNPSSALPDYIRFIETFGQQIRNGILGLFAEGRTDITSAVMQETVSGSMKDAAEDDRRAIIETLNEEYINHWLRDNGLPEDSIIVKFSPIDKNDEQYDAIIERTKSEIIRNIASAGFEIPKEILERLGIEKLKKSDTAKPDRSMQGTQGEPVAGQKPTGAK